MHTHRQQLGHWTAARWSWTCHRTTRFEAEFPRGRLQDGENRDRGRIQKLHEREERYWHITDQPTCTDYALRQRAIADKAAGC
jgi:hypothetical protein